MVNENVFLRFSKIVAKHPDNPALEVNNKIYSYFELHKLALGIASILANYVEEQFVGILSSRSLSTYAGILGTLAAKKCYVPFNPKFPVERIKKIISLTNCKIFIIDQEFFQILNSLFDKTNGLIIITPEIESPVLKLASGVIHFNQYYIKTNSVINLKDLNTSNFAYLLFTSGTTGEPKGIPVTHVNLNAYLDNILPKYQINASDRCSQAFDTTFDPSFHDMFIAWSNGACLVVVPRNDLLAPVKFIKEKGITVWSSVPSMVNIIKRFRLDNKSSLPDVRYTLFTGEACPYGVFETWKKMAPNSLIINGYGPTELTINITDFKIPDNLLLKDCINSIVPIGKIFDKHSFIIFDNRELKNEGELAVEGPQVVSGYLNQPEKTAEFFIEINNQIYYKTGDIVRIDQNEVIHYLGRKDNQVQIRGYRVELGELESLITNITKNRVVAIGWPVKDGLTEGVVAFVEGSVDINLVLSQCKENLPEYMVPSNIICVSPFPLNINGKTDRNQLTKILDNHRFSRQ